MKGNTRRCSLANSGGSQFKLTSGSLSWEISSRNVMKQSMNRLDAEVSSFLLDLLLLFFLEFCHDFLPELYSTPNQRMDCLRYTVYLFNLSSIMGSKCNQWPNLTCFSSVNSCVICVLRLYQFFLFPHLYMQFFSCQKIPAMVWILGSSQDFCRTIKRKKEIPHKSDYGLKDKNS